MRVIIRNRWKYGAFNIGNVESIEIIYRWLKGDQKRGHVINAIIDTKRMYHLGQEHSCPGATDTLGGTDLVGLRTHALRMEERLEFNRPVYSVKFGIFDG